VGTLSNGKGRQTYEVPTDNKYFSEELLVWLSTNYKTCEVTEGTCWSREGGLRPEIKLSAQQNTPGNEDGTSVAVNCRRGTILLLLLKL